MLTMLVKFQDPSTSGHHTASLILEHRLVCGSCFTSQPRSLGFWGLGIVHFMYSPSRVAASMVYTAHSIDMVLLGQHTIDLL